MCVCVFVCACTLHLEHVVCVETTGQTSVSVLSHCPLCLLLARNLLSGLVGSPVRPRDAPVCSSPVLNSAEITHTYHNSQLFFLAWVLTLVLLVEDKYFPDCAMPPEAVDFLFLNSPEVHVLISF